MIIALTTMISMLLFPLFVLVNTTFGVGATFHLGVGGNGNVVGF
jgi:hypothetical protein